MSIYNRHEQHCPVCNQVVNDDQQIIEAHEIQFVGAAAYAWCPQCNRQVPGPWDAAYQVRWAEAFRRFSARVPSPQRPRRLWQLVDGAGATVELTLVPTDPAGYVLHYAENGETQTVERFRSRESALLRSDELRRRLQSRGFGPPRPDAPGTSADMRPTDLWTVTTHDGHCVQATVIPQGKLVILAWFIDDHAEGAEGFPNWDAALRRADALRLAYLTRRES